VALRGKQNINETGNVYGRLRVIHKDSSSSKAYWMCVCECGTYKSIAQNNLRAGKSTSCGCFMREQVSISRTSHGRSRDPIYEIFKGLLARCLNENHHAYNSYGGRGITVCDRWHRDTPNAFENFLEDMGERPSNKHSIDRINNDGDYSPGNCQWANSTAQANNRSSNRNLTYKGSTCTIAQWSLKLGVNAGTISVRKQRGWTDAQALGFEDRR
jgi:hypothetical protein